MVNTPTIPAVSGPDLLTAWAHLPLVAEISPLALAVLLALVGIFVAAVSVVLVYHWRRFPFEYDIFRWAERMYLSGVFALCVVAVAGILIAAA